MRARLFAVLAATGIVAGLAGLAAQPSGCYEPDVAECQYTCGPACPDGMVCNDEGRCVRSADKRCFPPDGPPLDVTDGNGG